MDLFPPAPRIQGAGGKRSILSTKWRMIKNPPPITPIQPMSEKHLSPGHLVRKAHTWASVKWMTPMIRQMCMSSVAGSYCPTATRGPTTNQEKGGVARMIRVSMPNQVPVIAPQMLGAGLVKTSSVAKGLLAGEGVSG